MTTQVLDIPKTGSAARIESSIDAYCLMIWSVRGHEPRESYFIVADERRMLGTSPGCASVDHSLDSGLGVSTVAQLGDTEAWIFETDPKAVRLNRLTAGFFEPIDHRVCSSISTPGRIGKPLAGRRTGDLGENQWGARIAAWVRRVPSPERTVRGSRRDRLGLPARWAHAAAAGRNEVS